MKCAANMCYVTWETSLKSLAVSAAAIYNFVHIKDTPAVIAADIITAI